MAVDLVVAIVEISNLRLQILRRITEAVQDRHHLEGGVVHARLIRLARRHDRRRLLRPPRNRLLFLARCVNHRTRNCNHRRVHRDWEITDQNGRGKQEVMVVIRLARNSEVNPAPHPLPARNPAGRTKAVDRSPQTGHLNREAGVNAVEVAHELAKHHIKRRVTVCGALVGGGPAAGTPQQGLQGT